MKQGKRRLLIILIIVTASILCAAFGIGNDIKKVSDIRFGIDIRGGVEAVFEPEGLERAPTDSELDAARNIIEARLDNLNITDREVTVDKNGGYIFIRFPWKSEETNFNPEEAIEELGEMAELTFRDEAGNILIEGKHVKHSSPNQDSSNMSKSYYASLEFDSEGAELFAKATKELIGKTMGIYMDDVCISSPIVQSEITGGSAIIDNMSSYEEAEELSNKINAGALPFSLKTTNFSTISPSLGNNALNVMICAGVIAFILVCIFMIVFYKLPGLVACITLIFQVTLQLLSISIPQYTLTLPGIAGIILSVGMAVDANIITAERISEELKTGMSTRMAVKSGYKSAFSSVLDGNITSGIVAAILMIFGSGAMLSFGYTLIIGMIINVFVGVLVSKQLLLSLLEYKGINNEKWFRKKKDLKIYNFYKNKKYCAIISGLVIVVGLIALFMNGIKLDTQFTGGVVLSFETEGEIPVDKIEDLVVKTTDRPVTVQVTSANVTNEQSIIITLAGNEGLSPQKQKEIAQEINNLSENFNAKLSQTYAVEPYIGAKALKNAILAIALSSIFIVIYVWIRFSVLSGLAAGVTAMIALVHDVLVVLFIFVIFSIPLNDAFVAVVLTIIGYSINDTIVLYDRIREEKKNKKDLNAIELVNESISMTMARSINTSFTTGICVLIILVAAVLFNIESIKEFALPMFFGIISGCYSSICIAGVLWAFWNKRKENK